MSPTGRLQISARLHDGALAGLAVDLQRPSVSQLFVGQIPEAVVKAIPYLYTLCAQAQRAAAQAALAAAGGEARRPVDDAALWIEMLHENLWRLLLDWPAALGVEPAQAAFVAWRAARQGDECLAETQKLLRGRLCEIAGLCQDKLLATDDAKPGVPARLSPQDWLLYWQGMAEQPPAMTRPLSIVAAYRARLAETEHAAQALASGMVYPVAAAGFDGWGVAQTVTARGILTHAVHVDEGRVLKYRVSAPTDAFFADAGGLQALLAGHRFNHREAARQALEQAVLALDPCLPYTLEINDA